MRIALCQINTTVGDFDGNARLITEAAVRAHAEGATLAVFPELTVCGYPPRDLLDRADFIARNRACIEQLASTLPRDLSAIVGFVAAGPRELPHASYNAAALIEHGAIARLFYKKLLPTYDVFDEARYFAPGDSAQVFLHRGQCVGVTICEDAWNDVDIPLRRAYPANPVAEVVAQGADVVVNLAASPFTLRKRVVRPQMLAGIALKHGRPLVFVNAIGGNDDLVFDGSSAMYGADGTLLARAHAFAEDVRVVELNVAGEIAAAPDTDAGAALDALVLGTRDYARKCGFKRALIGLSGGIDSALVAVIAAAALGKDNVLGVAMPTRYSSDHSVNDAHALASALGIHYEKHSIDAVFQSYLDNLKPTLEKLGPAPSVDTTFENLQARIRGNTLMAISNRLGHLLLTTGNKSELAVGYCTLYGDMAGGLAVISDLPKTFVYDVARECNRRAGTDVIPASTLTKAPSAELRPDQKDEDSLPPYPVLDAVLERLVEQGQSQADVIAAGFDAALVTRIASMVVATEYKRRQMPPGLIVTQKAFGPGRRYPIAQKYRF
jgi:NAD+ synthase (glutamine-hydrolysing)